MTVNLAKLPWALAIVERNGKPTIQLQSWWQSIANTLETAFATGEANDLTIQQAQAQLSVALADLAQAVADIEALSASLTGYQPLDDNLTAFSGLDSATGVIYQTDVHTFAKRTDFIDQTIGDARYVRQDQDSAPALLAYAGTTISNPPTQAEVQAVDAATKAASDKIDALIGKLQTVNVLT